MLGSAEDKLKTEGRIAEAEAEAGAEEGGHAGAKDPEFDTRIVGPWMDRWDLVHHNKHTAKHAEAKAKGESTSWHSDAKAGAVAAIEESKAD